MLSEQIDMVEANLQRLSLQLDDVPVQEVLLCRILLFLGHEMGLMLDHHIRPYGLNEAEFRVLTALFSQAEHRAHPGALCTRAQQTPANMSRIGDALVNRELITRELCAEDRRKMVLRITDKGERLVRELLPRMFGATRRTFRDMGAPERQQLIDQLKHLAGRLGEVLAEAPPTPVPEKIP